MIWHTSSRFQDMFEKQESLHGFGQTVHSAFEMKSSGARDQEEEKKKKHEHGLKRKLQRGIPSLNTSIRLTKSCAGARWASNSTTTSLLQSWILQTGTSVEPIRSPAFYYRAPYGR